VWAKNWRYLSWRTRQNEIPELPVLYVQFALNPVGLPSSTALTAISFHMSTADVIGSWKPAETK
jgi:hypothetical protein